jgi:hypothetical protein
LFEYAVHRAGCEIICQMPGDGYPAGFFQMLILAMTSQMFATIYHPSASIILIISRTFRMHSSSSLDLSWMCLLIRFLCQAPSPKRSGTYPARCPFLFRASVKRHAMTGSGLGRYARPGQPRVLEGVGGANREIPGRTFQRNFIVCSTYSVF